MSLSVQCPKCGRFLKPDSAAAAAVTCPSCNLKLAIPRQTQPAVATPTQQARPTAGHSVTGPAEFRVDCVNCSKSIRIPIKLAGRKGACPKCNAVFIIPHPPAAAPTGQPPRPVGVEAPIVVDEPELIDDPILVDDPLLIDEPIVLDDPFAAPLALRTGGGVNAPRGLDPNPFREPAIPASPVRAAHPQPQAYPLAQPYTPAQPGAWGATPGSAARTQPFAKRKPASTPTPIIITKICGIAILVVACIHSLIVLANGVPYFLMSKDEFRAKVNARPLQALSDPDSAAGFYFIGLTLGVILGLGYCGVVGYGGFQMFQLKHWGVALTAAILTTIPCNCFTFLLTIPLGIVSIVMVSQKVVRDAFG